MAFAHLHRHSEFSRLDGTGTAKQYAEQAAKHGQGWLAQTDHGTLSGALHHIEACKTEKIIPIAGVEAYYRPDRSSKETRQSWHLCLFAKDLKGWHNLMRIMSISNMEIEDGGGFYQKNVIDADVLREHRDGIVCSSACFQSWLAQMIYDGDSKAVTKYVKEMTSIYGEDFWIEIMPHDFDDQRTLNIELVRVAQELSVPLIATNDAHFPYKDWAETQRIAKIMGERKTFEMVRKDAEAGKDDYLAELTPTLYLAHEEEMYLWFQKHHPDLDEDIVDEAMKNTVEFAKRCRPFVLDKELKLPRLDAIIDKSAEDTLNEWIEEGWCRLIDTYPDEHWERWPKEVYLERIDHEFQVLKDNDVIDYFVLLGDCVRWARSQGIRVGPGRGSAAGCLISYLIRITGIDPISYGLLFERFLNPDRKGMPDIDMDFDAERRDEVKEYLSERFGKDHVASIITHQRFQAKKVLLDLGRVFDVPHMELRRVADKIIIRADDEETTLEEILPNIPELQEFKDEHPEIWEHALRLEGTVANAGKHAAGIIITPEPVSEYMSFERSKHGDLVTSWSDAADFQVISDHGFMKFDFLGLDALTMHEYACQLIKENTGEWVDLDALPAARDPYAADPEVLELFAEGHTMGLFQFASRGMTHFLKQIKPSSSFDLCAANAIYRPGAVKMTNEFAKRKRNPFLRTYWAPEVKPVMKETYGIVAYQEQVMEIGKVLADFTGGQADDMRKAMGKLYRIKGGTAAKDFMRRFEEQWFSVAPDRLSDREKAKTVWDLLLEFGHYGFNKSHSASYQLIGQQDGHLKKHHTPYFYAAKLTYADEDERKPFLREASLFGLEIVLPDVNTSAGGYGVGDDDELVLGLEAIKGVGPNAAPEIIRNRPYDNFVEFLEKNGPKVPLRPLIEAGACDSLAERQYLLSWVERSISPKKRAELEDAEEPLPQWQVWEHLHHNRKLKTPREVPEIIETPIEEYLDTLQADLLALPSASLNMTADQQEYLRLNTWSVADLEAEENGTHVIIGGEITKVDRKKTKTGRPFANVRLAFASEEWAVKFWEETLARYDHILHEGNLIMVNGDKDSWNDYIQVTAKIVVPLDELDIEGILEAQAEEG